LILDWEGHMWDVNWWQRTRRIFGRILSVWGVKLRRWLYLQIKNDVVCSSPRTLIWNLATYTQSICSSAKSWNGFSRWEVPSRKEESNQPLGLFCDNQGANFTFIRSAGATFYLIWNIETSISRRHFSQGIILLLLTLYSFPSYPSIAEFALKITPHHFNVPDWKVGLMSTLPIPK
jgi:hypothetical protein